MSERLEEIQSRVWKDKGTYAMGDNESREGYIYTLSDYDFEWLIQQAKRVEELEEEIKTHAPNGRNYTNEQYIGLLQENQRYKQALEEIKHELDVSHYSNYRTKAFRKRLFDTADNALRGESE